MLINIRPIKKVKFYHERRLAPVFLEDYRRLHRFSPEHVKFLAETFLVETNETRGGALSAIQRMEITLRYLSDPGFQRSVAYQVGVTQSTVSDTVRKTLSQIVAKADDWIIFPSTQEEVLLSKQQWYRKLGFPSCIGAIDCTHVRIEKPRGIFGDEFINRKNFPSMNVQATCDANCIFTSVDVGWPGSVHDNRVFKTSSLYQRLPNLFYSILLGDDGYGLTPFLMTPYKNPNSDVQKYYNKLHTNNRVTIEQSFGQLKRRFPILRYGVRLNMDKVCECILSCFILHNIAKILKEEDFDGEPEDVYPYEEPPLQDGGTLRAQGKTRRDSLADVVFNLYRE